jgi:hypothetical protein
VIATGNGTRLISNWIVGLTPDKSDYPKVSDSFRIARLSGPSVPFGVDLQIAIDPGSIRNEQGFEARSDGIRHALRLRNDSLFLADAPAPHEPSKEG